jgi:hypothetical protein
MVRERPERFGQWGRQILEAAQRGVPNLLATIHVAAQQDPQVRQALQEASEQE